MILVQLSAGQGPEECCNAVALALKAIHRECKKSEVTLDVIEQQPSKHGFQSLLLQLAGDNAFRISENWTGAMLWKCQSPFRPKHKRKNWFFSGETFELKEEKFDTTIRYQACRASGAGGQHLNTTDSAIRATHIDTGVSVRVESERSQHANKRLARALIFKKLKEGRLESMSQQEKKRWQQHIELERGNPKSIFSGIDFIRQ